MSIWQGERSGDKQQFDALIADRVRGSAFDLDGDESFNWTELQSPAGRMPLDMRHVLSHVYDFATPARRSPEPNTMLVLATGALGVLALRRRTPRGQEGVSIND
jgi:hypothetical protein